MLAGLPHLRSLADTHSDGHSGRGASIILEVGGADGSLKRAAGVTTDQQMRRKEETQAFLHYRFQPIYSSVQFKNGATTPGEQTDRAEEEHDDGCRSKAAHLLLLLPLLMIMMTYFIIVQDFNDFVAF